jgi:hypothetical protein
LLSFLQGCAAGALLAGLHLEFKEVYARVNGAGADLGAVGVDPTAYKALITAAENSSERLGAGAAVGKSGVVSLTVAPTSAMIAGPSDHSAKRAPRRRVHS